MNEVSKLVFLNTTLETLRTTRLLSQVTDSAPGLPGGRRYTSILRTAIGYHPATTGSARKSRIVISYHNGLSTAKSGGYQDLPVTSLKQTTGKGSTLIPITTKVKLSNLLRSKPGGRRAFGVRTVTTVIRPPPYRDGFYPPSTDPICVESPPFYADRMTSFVCVSFSFRLLLEISFLLFRFIKIEPISRNCYPLISTVRVKLKAGGQAIPPSDYEIRRATPRAQFQSLHLLLYKLLFTRS